MAKTKMFSGNRYEFLSGSSRITEVAKSKNFWKTKGYKYFRTEKKKMKDVILGNRMIFIKLYGRKTKPNR